MKNDLRHADQQLSLPHTLEDPEGRVDLANQSCRVDPGKDTRQKTIIPLFRRIFKIPHNDL